MGGTSLASTVGDTDPLEANRTTDWKNNNTQSFY